mgnify:CR=1 FL=1
MLFDALACNAMSDKTVGFRASHPDRLSSVITYTNLFVYLITGETSYHNSTALLTGLAVISCCSSVPVSMPKDFVRSFRTLVDWYFRILGEVFSNLSFLKQTKRIQGILYAYRYATKYPGHYTQFLTPISYKEMPIALWWNYRHLK